jgi:hypothetical protein
MSSESSGDFAYKRKIKNQKNMQNGIAHNGF